MKQGIKNTLIFVTGVSVGATGATLALRQFYTKFINETLTDEVDKQIATIKQEYKDDIERLEGEYQHKIAVLESQLEEKEPGKKEVKSEVKKKGTKKEQPQGTDYTKYSGKESKKVKDVKADAIREIKKDTTAKSGCYIIGFEDYTEQNGYDKTTVTYFAADDTYMDEEEAAIPGMNKRIGKLIDMLDEYGVGDDLYVRDDKASEDIEIIFNEGSYAGYVSEN